MNTQNDYSRSNRVGAFVVDLRGADVRDQVRALLAAQTAELRQEAGGALLRLICERARTTTPRLLVLDSPRPHRLREGRLSYEKLGTYSARTMTIRVHNRTARLQRTVAARTFLETVVHELMHHWDFEVLKLRKSLHTSGFYHRLGTLKRQILGLAEE